MSCLQLVSTTGNPSPSQCKFGHRFQMSILLQVVLVIIFFVYTSLNPVAFPPHSVFCITADKMDLPHRAYKAGGSVWWVPINCV